MTFVDGASISAAPQRRQVALVIVPGDKFSADARTCLARGYCRTVPVLPEQMAESIECGTSLSNVCLLDRRLQPVDVDWYRGHF